VVVIDEFGGFFRFPAGLIEKLLGFFRMASQLVFVGFLSFFYFVKRLDDMVLGFGQIGVAGRINIGFGPSGDSHPDKRQKNDESHRQLYAFILSLVDK
jgi:hypothetical protein